MKKKRWWNKLADKWRNADKSTKDLIKASAMSFALGGIVGGISSGTIVDRKAKNDIEELTKDAMVECVKAYDQGVKDGAKDPSLVNNITYK